MILHEFNTPGPWEAPGPRRKIKKYGDHKNMDYGGPENTVYRSTGTENTVYSSTGTEKKVTL